MAADLERDLGRWLGDLHALEQQALVHLRAARRLVRDPALAADLERHLAETERHRDTVRRFLDERDQRASRLKDVGATVNRLGFLAYTAVGPDAPGKMLVDSIAYEHLEIAAYRMLASAAGQAGDERLRASALAIAADEEEMAARLALRFDRAIDASRRWNGPAAHGVVPHLRDADALEAQAAALLTLGTRALRPRALIDYVRGERDRTRTQRARLSLRLGELGRRPSRLRASTMSAAGAAWAIVWATQPYTPAKLTCFLYAERHLEIAAYELLRREAALAGDSATTILATQLLEEERSAADTLAGLLTAAAGAALPAARESGSVSGGDPAPTPPGAAGCRGGR